MQKRAQPVYLNGAALFPQRKGFSFVVVILIVIGQCYALQEKSKSQRVSESR